jgi:hypothetical protein
MHGTCSQLDILKGDQTYTTLLGEDETRYLAYLYSDVAHATTEQPCPRAGYFRRFDPTSSRLHGLVATRLGGSAIATAWSASLRLLSRS